MKKNIKYIAASAAAALTFASVAVGTTFALFTAKDETTIDVKAGKIALKADVKIDNAWELGGEMTRNSDYNYTSSIGASISKDEYNVIHLDKLAPGDGAKFSFDLDNTNTNINIKSRLYVSLQGELAGALEVEAKLGNARQFAFKGEGTSYTTWEAVDAYENPTSYTVTVNFPDGDNGEILFGNDNNDNQYQDKEAVLVLGYEAIQGNAHTDDTLEAINTKLGTARYLYGANNTMYDALKDLDASQIEAIKDRGYVYGASSDQFYNFVDTPVDAYKYFKIYEAMPTTQDYSIYATGEGWTDIDNLTVGLDVGDVTTISNITYDRHDATDAHNVVIRTNGGNLTINAPTDTVSHYGYAEKVDVIAVANASYHENGTVQLVAVKEGHVKLEGKADVNEVYVYNNSQGDTKDTSFKEIKITVDNGVVIPNLSRSAVKIANEGTKVCTIVTDQAKDLYLFNEGIYEQIKTVDAGKAITDSSVAWADSNVNTANTQTAAQQLANEFNGTYDDNGKIADKEVVVTGESAGSYTVKFNEETREFETYQGDVKVTDEAVVEAVAEVAQVASDAGKTEEEAQTISALKGSGTQANPFLVYDRETMQKISDLYDLGYYYFAVDLAKTDNGKIDCTGWVPVKLHGSFDGKGVEFDNVTAVLFQTVGYQLKNEEIYLKDFDATMNVSSNGQYGAAALVKNIFNSGVTTFDNVDVHGYLEGFWNMGSYYNYGTANYDDKGSDYEVVFNNCYSDATIVCASGNVIGGLFGHAYEGAGNSFTFRVNNSEYAGHMFLTTAAGKGNKYFGMTSDYYNSNNHFYFNGVEDTFNNGDSKNAKAYTNSTKIADIKATKTQDGYVVNKQENASKVVATITAQLTAYDDNNAKIANLSGITMTLSSVEFTELDETINVLDLFNSVVINNNASEYSSNVSNDTLNINLASSSNYKSGNIRLQVNQYDYSTGAIVSAGTIDIVTCANATSDWIIK